MPVELFPLTLYQGTGCIIGISLTEEGNEDWRSGDCRRVKIQTLRYYERRRLLSAPRRRESGYREYAPDAVELVRPKPNRSDPSMLLSETRSRPSLLADRFSCHIRDRRDLLPGRFRIRGASCHLNEGVYGIPMGVPRGMRLTAGLSRVIERVPIHLFLGELTNGFL